MATPDRSENEALLQAAITHGLITQDQLVDLAREALHHDSDYDVGQILVEQGYISEDQLRVLRKSLDGEIGEDLELQRTVQVEPERTVRVEEGEETLLLDPGEAGLLAEETVPESPAEGQPDQQSSASVELWKADSSELSPREAPPAEPALTEESPISSNVSQGASRSAAAQRVSSARQMTDADRDRIRRAAAGENLDLVGVNLGGYRIEGRLGSGGMGDVYEATQIALDRRVALKVLPTHMAKHENYINKFFEEARTLASFTHANIVQVYDVGEAEGLHYFTMEKVEGHTLRDLISEDETVPVEVCTNLMKQCLRGLHRAKKAGVIHRDIKPGNILISDQGDLKLVDFGLAAIISDSGAFESDEIVGTPLYISPEQAAGLPQTFKTDMYSLGATFYHLCTGEPPYRGKSSYETTQLHIEAPIPNASDRKSEIPPTFSAILQKMMAKQPEERFKDYNDLFQMIEAFELAEGIIKSPTDFLAESLLNIGDRGVRHIWRKIGLMSAVGLALTVLAIAVHNLLRSWGHHSWLSLTGDVGTAFFAMAVLFIAYVAMARRRMIPVFGQIRVWMYAHIFCALISFFLVTIHSGNFFQWFYTKDGGFLSKGQVTYQYADRNIYDFVPIIPFLNSLIFLVVIVSGLVGATIWRDISKQVTLERIQAGKNPPPKDTRMTMSVFSQTVFKFWRIIHYPLAVALGLLTLLHVLSILWYRGM
ncbi:serine/threonine protein kinase [bacterium]|nr:serine/threonine protein kinase [bacterium]